MRVYPLPDDPERCLEDFLELAAEHARELAEQLGRQEASVQRFLELSGDDFHADRLARLHLSARAADTRPASSSASASSSSSASRALLARALSGDRHRARARARDREAQARGDADAVLAQTPACAPQPACVGRHARRSWPSSSGPGEVADPPVPPVGPAPAHDARPATGRVAWRAGQRPPGRPVRARAPRRPADRRATSSCSRSPRRSATRRAAR